jgi:hypothetical protein
MPGQGGHDGLVVGHDWLLIGHHGMLVGSPHRHFRENRNPWMPDQVGHDGLVVGHDDIEAAGARLKAFLTR